MNIPSTTFTSTHTARDAFGALKAAKHPEISMPEGHVEMMDDLYVLALERSSANVPEGIRTTVVGDSRVSTFLGEMKGGCPVEAVKKAGTSQPCPPQTDRDRFKKLCARVVRSDIGRPLIPRTADKSFELATVGGLQANLRLCGIFTISDDRGFLRDALRTAPGLLVTSIAIEEVMRAINAKEAVTHSAIDLVIKARVAAGGRIRTEIN